MKQDWQRWCVRDGQNGPMVWEVKHTPFCLQEPDGLPGSRRHLVIARNHPFPAWRPMSF